MKLVTSTPCFGQLWVHHLLCPHNCYVHTIAMSTQLLCPHICYVHTIVMSTQLLCPHNCYVHTFAISTLMRFHLPLGLSRFHTAFVKGMPFGACQGRMPQPVLTSASVVVQLLTSVDGELDGGIWCCSVSRYTRKCCAYSFKKFNKNAKNTGDRYELTII
jgi:hypothetical protein